MRSSDKIAYMFTLIVLGVSVIVCSFTIVRLEKEVAAYEVSLRNAEVQLKRQDTYLKVYRDKYKQDN